MRKAFRNNQSFLIRAEITSYYFENSRKTDREEERERYNLKKQSIDKRKKEKKKTSANYIRVLPKNEKHVPAEEE